MYNKRLYHKKDPKKKGKENGAQIYSFPPKKKKVKFTESA